MPAKRADMIALEEEGFPRMSRSGVALWYHRYPLVLTRTLWAGRFQDAVGSNSVSVSLGLGRNFRAATPVRDNGNLSVQLLHQRRQLGVLKLRFCESAAEGGGNSKVPATRGRLGTSNGVSQVFSFLNCCCLKGAALLNILRHYLESCDLRQYRPELFLRALFQTREVASAQDCLGGAALHRVAPRTGEQRSELGRVTTRNLGDAL
jgi:hypothetical protein